MTDVAFPVGLRLERLARNHRRSGFLSDEAKVDAWLQTKALQHQEKRLSVTKVLLTIDNAIAGYFSLATGQVDFGDLPADLAKGLPRRAVPVAIVAWLGVATTHQGQGLGRSLLAQALLDCYLAGQTFAFVAVILDCVNPAAKAFYQQFDFAELPGNPYRLFLSSARLQGMMTS